MEIISSSEFDSRKVVFSESIKVKGYTLIEIGYDNSEYLYMSAPTSSMTIYDTVEYGKLLLYKVNNTNFSDAINRLYATIRSHLINSIGHINMTSMINENNIFVSRVILFDEIQNVPTDIVGSPIFKFTNIIITDDIVIIGVYAENIRINKF
jgi:hypothetical protein